MTEPTEPTEPTESTEPVDLREHARFVINLGKQRNWSQADSALVIANGVLDLAARVAELEGLMIEALAAGMKAHQASYDKARYEEIPFYTGVMMGTLMKANIPDAAERAQELNLHTHLQKVNLNIYKEESKSVE